MDGLAPHWSTFNNAILFNGNKPAASGHSLYYFHIDLMNESTSVVAAGSLQVIRPEQADKIKAPQYGRHLFNASKRRHRRINLSVSALSLARIYGPPFYMA